MSRRKSILWVATCIVVVIVAGIYPPLIRASADETFYCYQDVSGNFDIRNMRRELNISFSGGLPENGHNFYPLAINLTKKQIGHLDEMVGDPKYIWFDASKVEESKEDKQWIITSPLLKFEFSELPPAVETLYFDQRTGYYSGIRQYFYETPGVTDYLVFISGRCDRRDVV